MILHVDMDAFYASIEERDRPELAGKPLIVGGKAEGRGVVAAANYAVRKFGVHSAMPTATALRLCPQATVLPPRLAYYAEISEQIREIFLQYTPLVEPLSLDEAFLDVAGCELLFGSAESIGRQIKQQISEQCRLVASVGVAPNKFLAKIASDLEKPDALVVVDPGQIQNFLDPLPVRRLWGVGRVTESALEKLQVRTIGQLRNLGPETLRSQFGTQGEHLWELSRGIDNRRVIPDRDAQSISHETTFASDIDDAEALQAWLWDLTDHVGRRLRRHGLRGRSVQLKLRFSDFRTITRSRRLPQSTDVTEEIGHTAAELLSAALPKRSPIRLLGVGVHGLEKSAAVQRSLFDEPDRDRQRRLDAMSDKIQKQFGNAALSRASGILHQASHKPAPKPGKSDFDCDR